MSTARSGGKRRAETPRRDMAVDTSKRVRSAAASIIWLVAVLAALTLAAGALVVALDFNQSNAIVDFVIRAAERIDLGTFKDFEPKDKTAGAADDARVKEALVNWGLAAVIYLVIGKAADRLLRPRGGVRS